jgi:tetratricopeptide (TPR) repeat protein
VTIAESTLAAELLTKGWSVPSVLRRAIRYGGYFLLFAWVWVTIVVDAVQVDAAVHFFYAVLLFGYAVYLVLRRKLPGPTPFDLPLAVLALVYAAAIAASPYSSIALESSLVIVAPGLLFYFLHDLWIFKLELLVRLLVVVLAVLAGRAVVASAGSYIEDLQLRSAVLGGLSAGDLLPSTLYRARDLVHPNTLGQMLLTMLPFALAISLQPSSRIERFFGGIALTLGAAALVLTGSRSVWLAAIVATPLFTILYVAGSLGGAILPRVKQFVRDHARLLAAASVIGLTVGMMAVLVLWVARPAWLFRETVSSRFELASVALDIAVDRPVLGFGPDTYGLLQFAYGGDEVGGLWHPHNNYLDVLTGTGLAGVGAFSLLGIAAAIAIRRALRQSDPRLRALVAACAAAATMPFVTGIFEVTLHWGTILLPLAVGFAVLARLAPAAAIPSLTSRVPRLVIALLIPFLLYAWAAIDSNVVAFNQSTDALDDGRLDEAAIAAAEAVSADPDSIAHQLNAGVIQVLIYQRQLTAGNADTTTLDRAVSHLRRAEELDPRSFLVYANLAQALRLKTDPEAAVEAARRSLDLSPDDHGATRWLVDPSIAAAAGTVFEWAGRPDEAVAAYARALRLDPTLSQSSFWSTTPERQALRSRVIEASGLSACEMGRYAALYGNDRNELGRLITACEVDMRSASDASSLAMMLDSVGRHEEASIVAQEAMRMAGGSREARTALGFVLDGRDIGEARRLYLAGDVDSPLLLALTYVSDADAAPGLPPSVRERLEPLSLTKSLGRTYYNAGLGRSPPGIVLIPADWQLLHSPRLAGAAAIASRYPAEETGVPIFVVLFVPAALINYPALGLVFLIPLAGVGILYVRTGRS